MRNSTLYMAVIALLGLALGVGLVTEFTGSEEPATNPTGDGSTGSWTETSSSGVSGRQEVAEAQGNLKHGELNWQKKPNQKKIQPVKKRTMYERERDLVKPDTAEGNPVR